MSVVWCSHCKSPLTTAESLSGTCAMCGAPLFPTIGPDDSLPAPNTKQVIPSFLKRWQLWFGIAAMELLVASAGLVALTWPDRHYDLAETPIKSDEEEKKTPEVKSTLLKEVKPVPAPVPVLVMGPPAELKPPPLIGPPEELKAPPFVPLVKSVFVGPPDNLQPKLPPAKNPLLIGNTVKIDDPDGEYFIDLVQNKSVKLSGKVKRLKIGFVSTRALLDASELEAKEIVILRGVHNESSVRLFAPNGKVEFGGPINARSKVFIVAPNGAVTFNANAAPILTESKITIAAGCVDFQDRIHGWSTEVSATLSAGGYLKFKELNGGAKVFLKKANPKDPAIEIFAGNVIGQSELRKLE